MEFDGLYLRELRQKRALSLRDLSALSGVSYDAIHAIETGSRQPRPTTVRRLADALEVSPGDFYGEPERGKAAA